MTDEEIIGKIQTGEKEAYAEIVERYEGKLYGYLRHLINQPHEEVEDILQDVFISAYINIRGFDTKKQFSSWIYRIAHNKAIDFFKAGKLKRRFRPGLNEENDDWIDQIKDNDKLIEELEIESEQKELIARAINQLELKYKEAIELYFFEEKSYEEMSDILHLPTTNIGVLLYRAKDKLKKLLVESPKSKV